MFLRGLSFFCAVLPYNIPGIGQAMITAIQGSDYMMIMGLTIMFSFITVIMYFVVDVLYGIVDPRIRIS